MVDKMLRPSASRNANGIEKDRLRKRISERPVAPQPPSPYEKDNETDNAVSGNTAPRREPHSRLELLEEALQERARARPQKSSIRLEEVTKDSFEDVDDYSFRSPPSPADNEEWEQVADDMSAVPVSSAKNHCSRAYVFISALLLTTAHVASRGIVPLPGYLARRAFRHL